MFYLIQVAALSLLLFLGLFEDGGRGMGATTNLPKLRKFVQLMKDDGHVFKNG